MDALNLVFITQLAQAHYNCDAYGSGSYNEGTDACQQTTQPPQPGTPEPGTTLVDTGSPYFIPLITGALLILVAIGLIVSRVIKRRKA